MGVQYQPQHGAERAQAAQRQLYGLDQGHLPNPISLPSAFSSFSAPLAYNAMPIRPSPPPQTWIRPKCERMPCLCARTCRQRPPGRWPPAPLHFHTPLPFPRGLCVPLHLPPPIAAAAHPRGACLAYNKLRLPMCHAYLVTRAAPRGRIRCRGQEPLCTCAEEARVVGLRIQKKAAPA